MASLSHSLNWRAPPITLLGDSFSFPAVYDGGASYIYFHCFRNLRLGFFFFYSSRHPPYYQRWCFISLLSSCVTFFLEESGFSSSGILYWARFTRFQTPSCFLQTDPNPGFSDFFSSFLFLCCSTLTRVSLLVLAPPCFISLYASILAGLSPDGRTPTPRSFWCLFSFVRFASSFFPLGFLDFSSPILPWGMPFAPKFLFFAYDRFFLPFFRLWSFSFYGLVFWFLLPSVSFLVLSPVYSWMLFFWIFCVVWSLTYFFLYFCFFRCRWVDWTSNGCDVGACE